MSMKRVGALAFLGLTVATGFAGFKVRAAVHPSVNETLDAARNRAQLGQKNEAAGYAQSMLMGEKLTVLVRYGDTPPSQVQACDDAVAGAFKMWETALDGSVMFERVLENTKADIKITFGSDVKLNNSIVSGYINWTRNIANTEEGTKPVFEADIHLRTTDPKGRELKWEAMRHTCGHEMGHMFGLDDVNQIGMLMGPLDIRKPVKAPNESEVETVKAIREEAQSIVTASSGTHAHHFDGGCSCGHDQHH
jgi:predicted Zn-dependent protease